MKYNSDSKDSYTNTPPYNNCDSITLSGLIDDIIMAQDTELTTHASDCVCWPQHEEELL